MRCSRRPCRCPGLPRSWRRTPCSVPDDAGNSSPGCTLWIAIVLTHYVRGGYLAWRVPILFVVLLFSSLLTWMGANAWLSWMGDLIPSNIRGRYFGVRQIFEILVEMTGALCVGWYLTNGPVTHTQYVLVVCILVGFGIVDILIFRLWVPHPVLRPTRMRGELRDLIRPALRDQRYRRLVAFLAVWMFSSGLMQPYMWVFIKGEEYLGASYWIGGTIWAVSCAARGASSYFWGHLGDHWSPRRVLKLCVLISVASPFHYLLATRQTLWPVYLGYVVGSVSWAGIFVFMFQYGISMAPSKERSVYLAFQGVVLGLVGTAAYLSAGGIVWLLQWVALPEGLCDLQLLFCLAGVGRLVSLVPLSRMENTRRS